MSSYNNKKDTKQFDSLWFDGISEFGLAMQDINICLTVVVGIISLIIVSFDGKSSDRIEVIIILLLTFTIILVIHIILRKVMTKYQTIAFIIGLSFILSFLSRLIKSSQSLEKCNTTIYFDNKGNTNKTQQANQFATLLYAK